MEIILVIILIICSIIIFKNKDKRYPILGWLVCTIILAVGLYLLYSAYNGAADNAAFNAGYQDALK